MATYFCAECNHETPELSCELCGERTETLDVKDDPLMGRSLDADFAMAGQRNEDDLYL